MAALKAGRLGDASDSSPRPSVFDQSLADLMERELDALLQAEGRPQLTIDNSQASRDRRLLLVAIARGVVRCLHDNPDAFAIANLPQHPTAKIDIHVDL
jgi:hypothetical protein